MKDLDQILPPLKADPWEVGRQSISVIDDGIVRQPAKGLKIMRVKLSTSKTERGNCVQSE